MHCCAEVDAETQIEQATVNLVIVFRRWCIRKGIEPPTVDEYRRILDEAGLIVALSLPEYALLGGPTDD